jgi:mono/diheme cytochrome c family protein
MPVTVRTSIARLLLCLVALPCLAADSVTLDFNRYLEGKFVYERNCIPCHGARGDGRGELGITLQPGPRSFREGMFKFRSTPPGALPTEADLVRTIQGGLSGTGMGMLTHLRDDEVRAVIEYVKSFSRRWRNAENHAEPMKLPAPPAWLHDPSQRRTHARAGQPLFQAFCAACHGPQADGKGPAIAGVKDLWSQPAKPSDLRQPHLRCGDSPADFYRVLATGLNGTPMVSFEAALTPEQRWDIIAYVFTLRLPDRPTLGAAPASSLLLKSQP